jgi:PHD/YefM family antitoxin component YafN of YafNO toxin-antitoxin module
VEIGIQGTLDRTVLTYVIAYATKGSGMAITATAARKDFYRLIDETHLRRSPANAALLASSAAQVWQCRYHY